MDKFNRIYRQIIEQQNRSVYRSSLISEDSFWDNPVQAVVNRVLKPVGRAATNIIDGIENLGSGAFSKLGKNLQLVIEHPLDFAKNILEIPADLITGLIDLIKGEPPEEIKMIAQSLTDQDVQAILAKNPKLAAQAKGLNSRDKKYLIAAAILVNAVNPKTINLKTPATSGGSSGSNRTKALNVDNDPKIQEYKKLLIPIMAKIQGQDAQLIAKRVDRRINTGKIFVVSADKKITLVTIDELLENFDEYIQILEDLSVQMKKDDDYQTKVNDRDYKAKKLLKTLIAQKLKYSTGMFSSEYATTEKDIIDHWDELGPKIARMPQFSRTSANKAAFENLDRYCKSKK